MDIVLEIARYVLIIGGALCVLLLLYALLQFAMILARTKGMVNNAQKSYQQMMMGLGPVKKLSDWFLEAPEDLDDDEDW